MSVQAKFTMRLITLVEPEIVELIDQLAKDRRISRGSIVREAIQEYFSLEREGEELLEENKP